MKIRIECKYEPQLNYPFLVSGYDGEKCLYTGTSNVGFEEAELELTMYLRKIKAQITIKPPVPEPKEIEI